MKIIKIKDHEIDVKRFYLPAKFNVNCPHCGVKNKIDLMDRYLSFPITNKNELFTLECEECEGEFGFDIKLKMKLEIDTEARKL